MQAFLDLLHELTRIPAVAGYEKPLEDWLINYATQHNFPFSHHPTYGVIIGNPHAPVYGIAHIDEVGGVISHIHPTIAMEGIGRVNTSLFAGSQVDIVTQSGKIVTGLAVGKDPLVTKYDTWRDMQIVVDDTERDLVFVGDSVRPHHQWMLGKTSLQGTVLDNRIGVAQLLLVAHERQKQNRNRDEIALCFCTEEEIRNKGALYYMQTYKPKKLIIPDICPLSLVEDLDMHRCAVIGKTDDFVLDTTFESQARDLGCSIVSSTSKYLHDTEPKKYSDYLGGIPAINVMTPVYNYHHGVYFVHLDALDHATSVVKTMLVE